MHLDGKVQEYLRRSYGIETKLLGIETLGEGVHGVGYLIKFSTPHEEHRLIMKNAPLFTDHSSLWLSSWLSRARKT